MNRQGLFLSAAALFLVSNIAFASATVNFIHLAPFDPQLGDTAVSVNLGRQPLTERARYRQSSRYVPVAPENMGAQPLVINSPAGSNVEAIRDKLFVADNATYTAAAIGDGANFPVEVLVLEDEPPRAANGLARIRIVHAAPFAPTLDGTALSVRNGAGEVVAGLGELRYRADSGFISLLPGTYDLEFADPNTATPRLTPRPVTVSSGDVVTLFLTGDDANQPLGLLMMGPDGVGTVLGAPLPSLSAFAAISGWAGYIALGLVIACFVGVKLHRREDHRQKRSDDETPERRRSIQVRHI